MSKKESDQVRIPGGTVHRTIGLLQKAVRLLNVDIEESTVERIGIMINRAMSMQQRSFHTPEHIFDLANPEDAHGTLTALFHDIVYFQVDQGFLPEIKELLNPYIIVSHGTVRIRGNIPGDDRAFFGTAGVFGFTPGKELSPFAGLNEFLSALVMNILLEGILKDVDLLIATAGIEMTIPFRKPDKNGNCPPELLYERVVELNKQFSLALTDQDIKKTVIAAVRFANRDVRNFSEEDPGSFLDNTWKLLPESNPELMFQGLFTIRSYSTALMKMEGFLGSLNPNAVFQRYGDFPEEGEYKLLLEHTATNLTTGALYLGIKMVSAAILLALAELSGGDAPISFFMGDINPEDEWSRLSTHLPEAPDDSAGATYKDRVLYRLLETGRSGSSPFDLSNSPLSLFVYRCLSDEEIEQAIKASREFLKGNSEPRSCLNVVPAHLVESIARAAAVMAFTRREKLLEIAEGYGGVRQQTE